MDREEKWAKRAYVWRRLSNEALDEDPYISEVCDGMADQAVMMARFWAKWK